MRNTLMTFDDILALEKERQALEEKHVTGQVREIPTKEELKKHLRLCMTRPNKSHQDDPLTVWMGTWVEKNLILEKPVHQCYWNDVFCEAVLCRFPLIQQQTAAWMLIRNGIIGYAEAQTHAGYKLADTLEYLGISPQTHNMRNAEIGYCNLSKELIRIIARMFNIPMPFTNQNISHLGGQILQRVILV